MVVVVAGRVLSASHHHLVSFGLLRPVGNHVTLALLGHHMPDITFLRFDVIGYLVRLVLVFVVLEDRFADPFILRGVIDAFRINGTAVEVHAYELTRELHVVVSQFAFPVQVGVAVMMHDHGVVRLVINRRRQLALFRL